MPERIEKLPISARQRGRPHPSTLKGFYVAPESIARPYGVTAQERFSDQRLFSFRGQMHPLHFPDIRDDRARASPQCSRRSIARNAEFGSYTGTSISLPQAPQSGVNRPLHSRPESAVKHSRRTASNPKLCGASDLRVSGIKPAQCRLLGHPPRPATPPSNFLSRVSILRQNTKSGDTQRCQLRRVVDPK